jgi:hypothetical protein
MDIQEILRFLYNSKKGDLFRVEIEDKMKVIEIKEVYEFERRDN